MLPRTSTLDVREDFRLGQHPREKIMRAFDQVGIGETLRLLVPFEPVPLYEVANSKGLGHTAQKISDGDWEVLFTRNASNASESQRRDNNSATSQNRAGGNAGPIEVLDVDARGLEPPQPMVKILEAVAGLADGAALRARTDRRPVHLYPMLESRGFSGESEEQTDGSFITHIRRS
jgi:uncharacterized protein (DUF2249 family)